MSLDTLLDSIHRAHGGAPSGGGLGYQDPAWIAGGVVLLREAARDMGYWTKFGAGKCTAAQLRAIVMRVIERGKETISTIAGKLAGKAVDLSKWARLSLGCLIPTYQAGSLALGGVTDLDQPARKDLAGLIGKQAKWLGGFRDQIRRGIQPVRDEDGNPSRGFINRISLYVEATWGTAMAVERGHQIRAGRRSERRELGAAKSCKTCLDEAKKGWVKIGSLRDIGDSPCGPMCKCIFSFR